MPTFVIHSMGQAAQKSTWDVREIRVGRDPAHNHLVLPGSTVSREHAVFRMVPDRRWSVKCVSETNPIVVDGALTGSEVFVAEGSEILIGTEYLLVFSKTEFAAQAYMGHKSHFAKSECSRCHWSGMVSSLRRQPVCPKCGGVDLRAESEYQRDLASRKATNEQTAAVDPLMVKAELAKLRAAKRSHIERLDDHEPGASRKPLDEGSAFLIGKDPAAGFKLTGFVIGQGVRLAWEGSRWVAQASLTMPGMKVNGNKTDRIALNNGDVIEVGSNRFRFVVE